MEQIYYNKFCEYVDKAKKRIEEFDKEYDAFISEFFTDDVNKMMKNIKAPVNIPYAHEGHHTIQVIPSRHIKVVTPLTAIDTCPLALPPFLEMKSFAEMDYDKVDEAFGNWLGLYKGRREAFEFVVAHAQDVLKKIGEIYEEVTNIRMAKMKYYEDFFGEKTDKVKHIKVTVEWME